MTPEQAEKIANWLSERSAPKPSPSQRAALQKDLLPFQYEKVVDRAKAHIVDSSWFPVISQIAPVPELKPYKNTFKPGIKGKEGVKLIKKALEKAKESK